MRPSGCTATARATNVSALVSVETRPSPEKDGSRSPGAAVAGAAARAHAASAAARRRTLTSMSGPTLPQGRCRVARSFVHEAAVLEQRRAVRAEAAAVAQVADHVPVDGRLVRAARLGIGAADREMDRAADLLVEEDRADGTVDPEVRADADLAEPRGARIRGERLAQVGLAAVGARADHTALAELELDPLDGHAARARGDREADPALRGVLDRTREDLARGHVAAAVGVDPCASLDAQAQVGALRLDAQLARVREAIDQPGLARAELAP